ncbi:hypothetical protein BSF44_22910 [Pseudomonas sp. ACN8]|nr:hypothetical protein BSF44_22910 [Pseudomonas sp. ACN8]
MIAISYMAQLIHKGPYSNMVSNFNNLLVKVGSYDIS